MRSCKKFIAMILAIAMMTSMNTKLVVGASKSKITKAYAIQKLIKKYKNSNFKKAKGTEYKVFKDKSSFSKKVKKSVSDGLKNKIIVKSKRFSPKARLTNTQLKSWLKKINNVGKYGVGVSKVIKKAKLKKYLTKKDFNRVLKYFDAAIKDSKDTKEADDGETSSQNPNDEPGEQVKTPGPSSEGKATTLPVQTLPPNANEGTNKITSFSLRRTSNPDLLCNITCSINQTNRTITATVPAGIDLSSVKPTFYLDGGTAYVRGVEQKSNTTAVNLIGNTKYVVKDAAGKEKWYSVIIKELDTGLPSVCINTSDNREIESKDVYKTATISISGGTVPYAKDLVQTTMQIKGRGNSTWWNDYRKKSYRMKFEKKTQVCDLTPEKNWILIANYSDKSLMRNYTAYEIARRISPENYAPRFRYVDVWLNGEFFGNYLLGDHVEISSTKVNIDKGKVAVGQTPPKDRGYLMEIDQRAKLEKPEDEGKTFFTTKHGVVVTFKDPDAEDLNREQFNYIRDYVQKAEDAIVSGVDVDKYIDVDSFIVWGLVNDIFKNTDSGFFSSCFFYKDKGGKLKMGPVWDFDISALNTDYGGEWFYQTDGWHTFNVQWLNPLRVNGSSRARMGQIWRNVKASQLDTIYKFMDETKEMIRKSFNENFKKWPRLGQYDWPNTQQVVNAKTLDAQVDIVKTFIRARIEWMDSRIKNY